MTKSKSRREVWNDEEFGRMTHIYVTEETRKRIAGHEEEFAGSWYRRTSFSYEPTMLYHTRISVPLVALHGGKFYPFYTEPDRVAKSAVSFIPLLKALNRR